MHPVSSSTSDFLTFQEILFKLIKTSLWLAGWLAGYL
jgi:hypothetical protein